MTLARCRLMGDQAVLVGIRSEGVSRFSGIRYALSPVGSRRFAPPEPCVLEGQTDATRAGAMAPQHPSLLSAVLGQMQGGQSEDCLHLTVWTPEDGLRDQALRPVLVWIHGGALQSGAGALDWYDGAHLARAGNVVVVAVNYRLGVLGWLCPTWGVANLGLLDQELALQWVSDHIASLGGDAQRITVMGQSAGGQCVAALLAREPRFQRIILQSAPLGRGCRSRAAATLLGDAVCRAAGVADLEAAQALPLAQWMQAQLEPGVRDVLAELQDGQGLFSLVADGHTLPLTLDLDALAASADVLIGTNRHEMAAFPGQRSGPEADRLGESVFAAPAQQWVNAALAAGRGTWHYRFDAAANERLGACHCMELPFVFGTHAAFKDAPMLEGLCPSQTLRLTQSVQSAWLSFVRQDAEPWPASPHLQLFE
jgi:para-nitrobenzyl esterase